MTTSLSSAATAPLLQALKPSPRMPVLFVGHGSPMNAIEDNAWRRSWQAVGTELLARTVQPQLILCVSAHWLTRGGWQLTGMANPKTIHDFGGFPQALFDQQYPVPGAPAVARSLAKELKSPATGAALGVDEGEWGLDHGTWSVLKPMFPQARIPVMQLSMDYSRAPAEHYALGQQLKALRERGVLIVGSGNIVHNLRLLEWNRDETEAFGFDWALETDQKVKEAIMSGNHSYLIDFRNNGEGFKLSIPTAEHYLPLLYTLAVQEKSENVLIFNDKPVQGALTMTSVAIGL